MLSYVQLSLALATVAVSLLVGGWLTRNRRVRKPVGLGSGLMLCVALGLIAWAVGPQWAAAQEKAPAKPADAATSATEAPAKPSAESPEAAPGQSKQAQAAAPRDWRDSYWTKLTAVLATLILPFVIASYLSKRWRMPDYFGRFAMVLLTLFASVAIVFLGWPPKLGIDLRGGVILVYQIQDEAPQSAGLADKAADKAAPGNGAHVGVDMDKLIAAVSRRVNPGGVKEVTIRPYGARQIEIIIPEADEAEVERTEGLISRIGTLEFRILANDRDHKSIIERARASDADRLYDSDGNILAWWVPVTVGQEKSFQSYSEIATRIREKSGRQLMEILVVKDPFDVSGDYLDKASTDMDQSGRPKVDFVFNSRGGQLFARLTGKNLPDDVQGFSRKLGIILDNHLYSAPAIRSTIAERGEITGDFTRQETEDLVNVLNAGSLPATLTKEPISRLYTGPLLGQDTIERGLNSIFVSMALVFVSVLVYYRFAGIVACTALALNGIMLLAIMIMVKAAFTLPGLAGFALTLGMAIDANVLIYERMREESARGAGLRTTIRNGFSRALSAIVDSNLTTMITAAVLYVIGSDQIRGFAVTLFLGIVLSMYTAIFVARVIFDVAEKRKWISEVKMMRALGETHVDFLAKRKLMIGASVVLILIGLVAAYQRGRGLFDIDFTGGVSLQLVFEEPQDIGTIRRELNDLPDVVVSDVRMSGEAPGRRFMVNTSTPPDVKDVEEYLGQVKAKVETIFGDKLSRNQVAIGKLTPIEAAEPAAAEPAAAKPGPKDQSRSLLPSTRLESAAFSLAMLGQAGGEAKLEAKPEAKVEAGPTAKPGPQAEAKPETKTVPAVPAAKQQGPDNPVLRRQFAGGTIARLTFVHRIRQMAVEVALRAVLDAQKLPKADFLVLDKNFEEPESEQVSAAQWNVLLNLSPEQADKVLTAVKQRLEAEPFFPSSNTIGGAVAENTRVRAVYALLASGIMILAYLWVRFQRVTYGLAAVIALVHDVLVALGFVALGYYLVIVPVLGPLFSFLLVEPFKVNLSMMAALLTIAGYSLNDTIVIFDRIREVRGKAPYLNDAMVNLSVNQTLGRTLLTGVTSMMVIVILYIAGGASIHGFAYAMIIGVVAGTYSSIYIASPILLWLAGTMDSQQSGKKRNSQAS